MYLHLGGDVTVMTDEIIGIFDLDNSTVSYKTREFLSEAEKSGKAQTLSYDLPKSFVICGNNEDDCKLYICQPAPATFIKRMEQFGKE